MVDVDLNRIELWCQDAERFLSKYLSPNLAEMTRETLARNSGKKRAILSIAADLAEGISDLPPQDRIEAQTLLKEKHGFGYEYFQQAKIRAIDTILERGKIRSLSEYEKAIDFVSDTTNNPESLEKMAQILGEYLSKLDKK